MSTGARRLARIPAEGLSELIEAGRRMGAVDLALGTPDGHGRRRR